MGKFVQRVLTFQKADFGVLYFLQSCFVFTLDDTGGTAEDSEIVYRREIADVKQ